MEFYQKLQKLRKDKGMSQEELASQLNVSRQAVSKWENGQGFPETEKLLQLSSMFGVSLDYLLKSDPPATEGNPEPGYYASRETVEGYLTSKRVGARRIALGVGFCILASLPAALIDNGIGFALLFLMIAIGVAILVAEGFRAKPYAEIEHQPLVFDSSFLQQFRSGQYLAIRKHFGRYIIFGIVLVLCAVASFPLLEMVLPASMAEAFSLTLFFVLVAFAVALFITGGSALSAAGLIANNPAHMAEVKNDNQYGWVYGVMMPLAAMVFLLIGFVWNAWHPGWLVFPVTAFLATAIVGALKHKNQ